MSGWEEVCNLFRLIFITCTMGGKVIEQTKMNVIDNLFDETIQQLEKCHQLKRFAQQQTEYDSYSAVVLNEEGGSEWEARGLITSREEDQWG